MRREDDLEFISEEMVEDYLFDRLLMLGYTPTVDEVTDLTHIFLDFLVDHGFVEDE